VTRSGKGGGKVVGQGITCGTDCTATYAENTKVTLVADPDADSQFAGWDHCDTVQEKSCVVTMVTAKAVTATFEPAPVETRDLVVEKSGAGTGTVSGSGISCGADCVQSYSVGQTVTLTAAPAPGSTFKGWADCDSVVGKVCEVTIDDDLTVGATFGVAKAVVKTEITDVAISSKKRKATFTFTGSSPFGGISFQCRMDNQKFGACSSPRTYKRLKPGSHTFEVRTIDGRATKDDTPAKSKFVIKK
jgi:hypothetical protein